jgi:DNA gyrase subunit A
MLALFAAANDFMVGAEVLGEEELILSVKEDSDLMIVTRDGKMIRIDPGEIRQVGRSTQGVRLVRMEENDQVAAA